jgi:hypothetical protein
MKIKVETQLFERVNKIDNFENAKNPCKSEELLLFEGFRRIHSVNVKINCMLNEDVFTLATINRIIPEEIIENIGEIISSKKRYKHYMPGVLGDSFVQMYLRWEMLSENNFIQELSFVNPFEFLVRILERGIIIDKVDGMLLVMSNHSFYNFRKLQSKENYQEMPYLVSTTDEYLDKINDFYEEHNVLPDWLEEDNKRGYLL